MLLTLPRVFLKNFFDTESSMPESSSRASAKIRHAIAKTAAKYVAVDGINDFLAAKRKAAAQLGLDPGKNMPSNMEVEQALVEYQNLFHGEHQVQVLLQMRRVTTRAMKFLQLFTPCLVGPVLRGTATHHSDIILHIFCEEPEQPGFFLQENGIPFQISSKRVRINNRDSVELPAYRFEAEDNSFVLVVFAGKQKKLAPMSGIDGKPEARANLRQVSELLGSPCGD